VTKTAEGSSKTIVYAALVGNALVAVTKIGAAVWTGSSAMMSEAVHSVVDTTNEVLLLYGYHRASRPPDESHPLGYGRELYFWSFIVALLIFALGAGASLYQGVIHVTAPEPIEDPVVSFVVLGLSFVFEGISWFFAWRRFRSETSRLGWYEAFVRSKDPPAFMVLLEDSAALVGIVIATAATAAAAFLAQPVWDGVGSILIGMLLGITSIGLARESKSLLIGEPAHSDLSRSILDIARHSPGVLRANGLLTVQLSPAEWSRR
jgi:cation diffusion facilitator family transporter